MARLTDDKTIDVHAISIRINGLANDSTNKRGDGTTDSSAISSDGFVYTHASQASADGKSYEYRYSDNKEIAENKILYINAASDTQPGRNAGYYRQLTGATAAKYEGLINHGTFNGKATADANFYYNEGNRGSPIDETISGSGTTTKTVENQDGTTTTTITNFYDENTSVFSDQLQKVRNL